jgi:putative addiction module killer protein
MRSCSAGAKVGEFEGSGILTNCPLQETIPDDRGPADRRFAGWFAGLRDREARARITVRIRRLSLGNPGDVKAVGSGVSEMRIDYGPGYRLYFVRRGDTIVVLLCGGDKRTQDRDIARAIGLAQEV